MSHRRFPIVLVLLTCFLALAGAPAAMALTAKVRVEASTGTVAPSTTVSVPSAPTFWDSDGNRYRTQEPNALAALAAAARARDFTWQAGADGAFVFNIAGFMALPDWSYGWVYTVNGAGFPVIDVAAIDCVLRQGDEVLWAQSPDATFALGSHALVAEPNKTTYTSGEDLTVTVKADSLQKVNSQADYDRYQLADESLLQTPDQFPAVEGATVHVGSATYTTDAEGTVTVSAPAAGNYLIWAEKDMDADAWYVRSPKTLVNFAPELTMTDASVSPRVFVPRKQKPKLTCELSRAASLQLQVRNARNRVIWKKTVRRDAGPASYTWNGKTSSGRYVARRAKFTMVVKARDTWGRSTPTVRIGLRTK